IHRDKDNNFFPFSQCRNNHLEHRILSDFNKTIALPFTAAALHCIYLSLQMVPTVLKLYKSDDIKILQAQFCRA
ncbi:MAG: hypothetical protein AAGJ80_08680, partial [Cyanobacteria bacterium J06553_1]